MTIFFTADHHFSMPKIIESCKRPFLDIEEHDLILVTSWNRLVKPDDTVYHLGDFTLKGMDIAKHFINLLNGKLNFLIDYNHHDRRWAKLDIYDYEWVRFYDTPLMLKGIYEKPIILSHFPYATWNRSIHGSIHFHGHSHGNLPKIKNRLDVGVDNAYKLLGEYRPFTLDEAVMFAEKE